MGKLKSRGWAARSPVMDPDDAAAFIQRCQESHTAQWKVDVHRWQAGENVLLARNVPVVDGTLTLDSSDPIRRQVSLTMGVGDEWVPYDKDSPLVPFGQFVHLFVRIDKRGGGWFPWLKLFEGPIQSNVFERPSLINTVEAADASQVVDDFLYLKRRAYAKGRTLKAVLKEIVDDALPGALYGVEASDASETTELPKAFHVEAGQSRLEAANELAGKHDQEVFFDGLGNLIIRRDLTDEDDDDWNPSEPGPDIGTVTSPVCIFRDGTGGNLLALTSTLAREGAVNRVQINRTAVVNRRKTGDAHATEKELWYSASAQAAGTVAYGDSFGRLPLVETESVPKLTDQVKANADHRARRLLQRRRGLLKFYDAEVLPQYWAEPDDKVRVISEGAEEHHYIQRVELPLDGGPMRVRTRTLSVTDPGAAPSPEWHTDLAELGERVRVMVDEDYTTPLGGDGFVPAATDYSNWSQASANYHIGRAFGWDTDNPVWNVAEVWDCCWSHAYAAERGEGPYWNAPPTDFTWNGAGACAAPMGAHSGPGLGTGGGWYVGWDIATYNSGGLSSADAGTRSLGVWLDYDHVLTTQLGGPGNGYPDPIPPFGYSLLWEDDHPTVTKVEVAIAEPTDATDNAGLIFVRHHAPADFGTKFGPDPDAQFTWDTYGLATPGGSLVGYEGGEGEWADATELIEETGKTWFVFVSDVIELQASHWAAGDPLPEQSAEHREDVMLAFRFTTRASRYRFVPSG